MSQNLKLRIITALVGAPVILALVLWLGVEGVSFFAWVISTGLLIEFCKLFFRLEDAKQKTAMAIAFNTLVHSCNYWFSVGISPAFLGLSTVFFFFLMFLFMVPRLLHFGGSKALNSESGIELLQKHVNELMAMCFGFVYCGWFPLLMVNIRTAPQGRHWLMLTLFVVWSNDVFAYFAGKYFGKRLLFETVSPKKTWEGAIGGLLGALLVAILYSHSFLPQVSVIEIIVITLAMSVASALGDLCESLIKRASNVKDSGSILPGHGGFLDRFDGVAFALPVMYAFLWLIF